MSVSVTKSGFNVREKLKQLQKPIGLKGSELMRSETAQEARDLVSAGRKNMIINGAMRVAQRGTSGTGSGYTSVDRFKLSTSSGDVTLSQGSLTSGSPYDKGFRNFLRVTNTSTTTATNGYRELDYSVEAQDLANSGWVISNSNSHATISFWVRSSVSQRFYMYIRCVDGTTKSYTFPFDTIANTWVKVEQTIPGDSTLTVNNDNGQGLLIRFVVHYGTNYTGSGATNNVWRVTGSDYTQDMSTSFALTAGATFDVTGLQLEAGKKATEFEHRSYGEELALCQRYYEVGNQSCWSGTTVANVTYARVMVDYKVEKRAVPGTITATTVDWGGGFNNSNPTTTTSSIRGFQWYKLATAGSNDSWNFITWTASAEL